jgi:hypothetical protein
VTILGEPDHGFVSRLVDSLRCRLPSPGIPDEISELIGFRTYEGMPAEIPRDKLQKPRKGRSSSDRTARSIQPLAEGPEIRMSEEEMGQEYLN